MKIFNWFKKNKKETTSDDTKILWLKNRIVLTKEYNKNGDLSNILILQKGKVGSRGLFIFYSNKFSSIFEKPNVQDIIFI